MNTTASPNHPARTIRDVMARGCVLPILTVHDVGQAAPLARALVDGGVFAFEVLLRTPVACDVVREMRAAAPEADVGLGTLLTPEDVERAVAAGAAFGVSPGLTDRLAAAVRAHGLPFLPGVATPSEVMAARDHGFRELKYFPAQSTAGISFLQAVAPVFPDVSFCPTGGIRQEDVLTYLRLPNCPLVGGSWIVPGDHLRAGNWAAITALARVAAGIASQAHDA
jgi:2-dehydro-3-deoxyphosphogluconate aldolase/(4S)-4-hydroxy-2-oxoglutarate aldolase